VTADAQVDHPSFAAALLSRWLESQGFTVGIIAQPHWGSAEAFTQWGRPRYAFLVTAGAMDSMVANYTANKKPRSADAYSHGGEAGHRPDRALIIYCAKIREAYADACIIIGGIEASLRRFAHYDYWSDKVRRSALLDTKADILVYGMGERAILELAHRLARGESLRGVRGTCWRTGRKADIPQNAVWLPSFEEAGVASPEGKLAFAQSYLIQEDNADPATGKLLAEQTEGRFVVQEPPAKPLSAAEFDRIMELPYTRRWDSRYDKPAANGKCGVPALQEVLFSLVSVRGCFGACSFCAIAFHQGQRIQARTHQSLIREAAALAKRPDFKGYIHDVGGPTANFRQSPCEKQARLGACKGRDCLGAAPCPALKADHGDYLALLRKLRQIPGVKKVFVRSGIRFDYLMLDPDAERTFLRELCEHHVSGQLKVAPEQVNDQVLGLLRKSSHRVYQEFAAAYTGMNRRLGKKQYLVPYYISSVPGEGLAEAIETALYLKKTGFAPDQVQDFYPTPGSLATCMYYTGLDPHTGQEVYVPRGTRERRLHRALLQFNKRENAPLLREALTKAGRRDLLGLFLG
jgi:uncharacterized radical SAM protein YgiQ